MRERLKKKPSETVIKYLFSPCINCDLERSFYPLIEINYVHVIMLLKQKIISLDDAKIILKTLKEIEKKGPKKLKIDHFSEDLYSNIEDYVIGKIGANVGGQLNTARSRNDLFGTVTRINSRKFLLKACSQINSLRLCILNLSKNNINTVMPGYTCMQPAEPITLGHYFSAHLHSLERDFSRLEKSYERLNQSPLGCAAMAGTTFNIDRELSSQLLGFSGPTKNSLDGIVSRDYVLEILSALGIFMINLSRLCHDLYIWSTDEFSFIEVSDSVAMCSSIMPQKKNPVTFEHIKAKAAHLQGAYVSASSSLKNSPFSQCRDSSVESIKYFWDSFSEVEASIYLLIETLETIKINGERMLDRARFDFSTVSELSNALVREAGLPNRSAHQVVANIVTHIIEHRQTPKDINSKLLAEMSKKILGREIILSDEKINSALDPLLNVNSRNVLGAPSPSEVGKQLKRQKIKIKEDIENILRHEDLLKEARSRLYNEVDSLIL